MFCIIIFTILLPALHWPRLGICQKIYTTKFSDERILHTENALIETFFARDKQRKCIIISNLALFWLKLNSYYESLHLGVCKLAKYVRNCVVFWKNLHSWQKFYTTAGRDGRDKFQVCQKTSSQFNNCQGNFLLIAKAVFVLAKAEFLRFLKGFVSILSRATALRQNQCQR